MPTGYPKHFVENVMKVRLNSAAVHIDDAFKLELSTITAKVQQRPSAAAIKLVYLLTIVAFAI